MKIQNIPVDKHYVQKFKHYEDSGDYGTYYNNPSVKEALVYSAVVTAIIFAGCAICECKNKINKNFNMKNISKKLNIFA